MNNPATSPSPDRLPNGKHNAVLRSVGLVAAITASTAVLYATGVVDFLMDRNRMEAFIHSLGPWGFAGFILLQVSQVLAAPIPGEITGFLGGYLYGPVLGVVLSTIGLTIGSYLAFSLALAFGRPLVERVADRETLERFDYLLHHKGIFLVFLLFLLPGMPKDVFCYILGLGRLTAWEFLAVTTAGRFLSTVMFTLCGCFTKAHEYAWLFFMVGTGIAMAIAGLVYRVRIEAIFRRLHERWQGKNPVA